jgi:hypothetical protein
MQAVHPGSTTRVVAAATVNAVIYLPAAHVVQQKLKMDSGYSSSSSSNRGATCAFVQCCQLKLPTWKRQHLVGHTTTVRRLIHLWRPQGLLGALLKAVGVCKL